MRRDELEKHPRSHLIDLIQQHNIKGYSKLNKTQLVDLIMKNKSKIDFSKLMPTPAEQKELKKYLKAQDKKDAMKREKETNKKLKQMKEKVTEGTKTGNFQTPKEMTAVKPTPKQVSKMKPPKKKFDVDEIEETLRKQIDEVYQDLIERFIDGRGSEEAQLIRAGARAGKYVFRRIKQYAKEQKLKTTEEFVKHIKASRSNFEDWLEF